MIYCREPIDANLVRKVNRFLCVVEVKGVETYAHIPNSGRLTELMTPGRRVILSSASNPDRKTRYSLRSVRYNNRWVCIDSMVPNSLAAGLAESGRLFRGYENVKRERAIGRHRFDLLLTGGAQRPMLVEVKSVTLVEGKTARFPDAPTKRGAAHLLALARLSNEGYRCAVLFVIQRSDAASFEPNEKTDVNFAQALKRAVKAGVTGTAIRCRVGRRSISPMGRVRVNI